MSDTIDETSVVESAAEYGGGGAVATSSKDFKLLRRAVVEGWPVGDEERAEGVQAAKDCINDSGASHRDRLSAASFFLAVDVARLRAMKDQDSSEQPQNQTNIQINNFPQGLSGLSDAELDVIINGTPDPGASSDTEGRA